MTQTYKTIGYARYASTQEVGFMLALFSTGTNSQLFFQSSGAGSSTIRSFLRLERTPGNLVLISNGPSVRLGDDLIYVFIDAKKRVICGPLNRIANELRIFLQSSPSHPEIGIQIAEILNSRQDQFKARKSFLGAIKALSKDPRATQSFLSSDMRVYIWERLLNEVEEYDAKQKLLESMKNLQIKISEGKVEFYFVEKIALAQEIVAQVILEAKEIYRDIVAELFGSDWHQSDDQEEIDDIVTAMMQRVDQLGRQSERIAAIYSTLVRFPKIAENLTRVNYTDRASAGREAFSLMTQHLRRNRFEGTNFEREQLLEVIWKAFVGGTSWIKAYVLHDFALAMPKDRIVIDFVFRKLSGSSSAYLYSLKQHLLKQGIEPSPRARKVGG